MIVQDNDLPNAKFEINELTDVVFQRKFIRCQIQSIKDQSKYHVGQYGWKRVEKSWKSIF